MPDPIMVTSSRSEDEGQPFFDFENAVEAHTTRLIALQLCSRIQPHRMRLAAKDDLINGRTCPGSSMPGPQMA
jgi:hypothetical protein